MVFGRFARPPGVCRPAESSSLRSSSLSFRLRPRLPPLVASGPESWTPGSPSSRLVVPGKGTDDAGGPDVTGLGTPRPLRPPPRPENTRPNSDLIPGSAAGPGSCGWAPCTACGSGLTRPLVRFISWTARWPRFCMCCAAESSFDLLLEDSREIWGFGGPYKLPWCSSSLGRGRCGGSC